MEYIGKFSFTLVDLHDRAVFVAQHNETFCSRNFANSRFDHLQLQRREIRQKIEILIY